MLEPVITVPLELMKPSLMEFLFRSALGTERRKSSHSLMDRDRANLNAKLIGCLTEVFCNSNIRKGRVCADNRLYVIKTR